MGDSGRSSARVPQAGRGRQLEDARRDLDALARFLDETFVIPGLRWAIGIEAIIGLVPVVGDVVSAGLGGLLIFRAIQFRLPGIVVARMAFNTLLDLAFGAVPFIGDLFDFAYRSNRRNIELFQRYAADPGRSTSREWFFFGGLVLIVIGLVWLLVLAVGWVIGQIAAAF